LWFNMIAYGDPLLTGYGLRVAAVQEAELPENLVST
jgi:hypothetical protein